MEENKPTFKSIRTFIGSVNFQISQSFYKDLGFEERIISEKMSLFITNGISFYLQDYYVKEWLENTMVLLEVDSVNNFYKHLQELELDKKYQNIKVIPVRQNDWGNECMLIDPSGVLWHFAEFKS
ncbi:glyoxalase [Sabulibacter ruber]|uniref:glyoxalase n=1 Tax=Sabulibacter ruber TaxID=2811901 RepID=UPI001F6128EB|nr:glyoxalase [Sabulibacter ruber]